MFENARHNEHEMKTFICLELGFECQDKHLTSHNFYNLLKLGRFQNKWNGQFIYKLFCKSLAECFVYPPR